MDKEKINKLRQILIPAKTVFVESNGLSASLKREFDFKCIKSFENIDTDLEFLNAVAASECIEFITGDNQREKILSQIIESANNIGLNPNENIILRFLL